MNPPLLYYHKIYIKGYSYELYNDQGHCLFNVPDSYFWLGLWQITIICECDDIQANELSSWCYNIITESFDGISAIVSDKV